MTIRFAQRYEPYYGSDYRTVVRIDNGKYYSWCNLTPTGLRWTDSCRMDASRDSMVEIKYVPVLRALLLTGSSIFNNKIGWGPE